MPHAYANVAIGPVPADERADWEPLWKGYQPFQSLKTALILLGFSLWRPHLGHR
jgi:hypothetical protein